jgi:hypothetical protein
MRPPPSAITRDARGAGDGMPPPRFHRPLGATDRQAPGLQAAGTKEKPGMVNSADLLFAEVGSDRDRHPRMPEKGMPPRPHHP